MEQVRDKHRRNTMSHRNFGSVETMRAFRGIAIVVTFLVIGPCLSFGATGSSQSSAPPDPGVVGVTAGAGSLPVYDTDTPILPRGFNSVGLLYPAPYASTMCADTGASGHHDRIARDGGEVAQSYTPATPGYDKTWKLTLADAHSKYSSLGFGVPVAAIRPMPIHLSLLRGLAPACTG